MDSPPKRAELMMIPYRDAKMLSKQNRALVDDFLDDCLLRARCKNCCEEIILDEPSDTAYCPKCESEVFLIRGGYDSQD